MQIEYCTSQASARASSAVMQGCVNLREKPTVHEVGQNVARSYQWYTVLHTYSWGTRSSYKKVVQRQRSGTASAGTKSGTSKPTKEHSFGKTTSSSLDLDMRNQPFEMIVRTSPVCM
jgi:hypothetical protein